MPQPRNGSAGPSVEERLEALAADIKAELDVLGPRFHKLTEQYQRLTGPPPSPTPSGSSTRARSGGSSGSSSGGSTRRRSGPNRSDEAVTLIAENPGITVAELAKKMGIAPNYLYKIRPELEAEGRIRREGSNLFVTEGNTGAREEALASSSSSS